MAQLRPGCTGKLLDAGPGSGSSRSHRTHDVYGVHVQAGTDTTLQPNNACVPETGKESSSGKQWRLLLPWRSLAQHIRQQWAPGKVCHGTRATEQPVPHRPKAVVELSCLVAASTSMSDQAVAVVHQRKADAVRHCLSQSSLTAATPMYAKRSCVDHTHQSCLAIKTGWDTSRCFFRYPSCATKIFPNSICSMTSEVMRLAPAGKHPGMQIFSIAAHMFSAACSNQLLPNIKHPQSCHISKSNPNHLQPIHCAQNH